jgi:AcrR family transcriptional regulator
MLGSLTWQELALQLYPEAQIGNHTPMAPPKSDHASTRARYHHGDLRQALIDATHQLLIEKGPDQLSLADACRLAGVSTAAPYKHFRDKLEILEAIVEQGFARLSEKSVAAARSKGEGTLEGVIAMGQAYLRFAVEETAVFRLMFGQNTALKQAEDVQTEGRACFSHVIEQVDFYCQRHKCEGDPRFIALQLWTFVHGAACLLIDSDYEKVAPNLDVSVLVSQAAVRLLPPGIETAQAKGRKGAARRKS